MACSQLDTIERAGRCGMGALGFQFVSADAAHAWVHAYYNAITKRLKRLADYAINPNIALVSFFMCAKTDEEASRRADGARSSSSRCASMAHPPTASARRPAPSTCGTSTTPGSAPTRTLQEAALRGGLIGSPDTHPQEARQVRDLPHRPGHPAQPGRQEYARAHLRVAGAVRRAR